MSEWQPIDTAPKDETAILVYSPAKIVNLISSAFWHRSYERWQIAFTGLSKEPTIIEPTHWMPLPEPPEPPEPPEQQPQQSTTMGGKGAG